MPLNLINRTLPNQSHPDVAALFSEHGRTVARWASRIGGPGFDVEDAVQEVFLLAGRKLGGYQGDANVTTWLFRTTMLVVRAQRRKARLHRRWAIFPSVFGESMVAPNREPGAALDDSDIAALVYRILDQLPEKHRRVLILFQMEELSTEQIGELLGVNPGTVRVWLHRARARFAFLYQGSEAGALGAPALFQERL